MIVDCLLCLGPSQRPLCNHCIEAFPPENADTPSPITLGAFRGPLKQAVLAAKLKGEIGLAFQLGQLLAEKALTVERPDAVTWVPSQRLNRWRRHGDTAASIAQGCADLLGLPCIATLQPAFEWHGRKRSKATREQHSPWQTLPHRACTLWLVDDVSTTGATLRQTQATLEAQGSRVSQTFCVAQA